MKIAKIDRFQNGSSMHVTELMIRITCDDFVCCYSLSFSFLHDQTDWLHTMQQLWLRWWHLFQCKSNIEEEIKRTQNQLAKQLQCRRRQRSERWESICDTNRSFIFTIHTQTHIHVFILFLVLVWTTIRPFFCFASLNSMANTILMCDILNQEDYNKWYYSWICAYTEYHLVNSFVLDAKPI